MLRSVARSSAARYVRTAVQAIRNETDFRSQLKQNDTCVVGFFEDGPESSRIAKTDLNSVSAEFANIPFLEVNGTRFPQLLRDHDIDRIPAVVTFRDGKMIDCRVNPDQNDMRSIIGDLPNAEQSEGIFSMFFGKQERQQQKNLEKRMEEARDKNARKEWETSPEDAVHKKHPLRAPDANTDNRAGLNTLATGLKEGYDEAMDDIQARSRKQRKQAGKEALSKDNVLILNDNTSSSEKRESSNRSHKNESNQKEFSTSNNRRDSSDNNNTQQSIGSRNNQRDQNESQQANQQFRSSNRRDSDSDNTQSRRNQRDQNENQQAANQQQNRNVQDTVRSDQKMDNKMNQQIKSNQKDNIADDKEVQGSFIDSNDNASRHGELETAKRSMKSGSGNMDMSNDSNAKRTNSSKRSSSNDQRPTSAERKAAQKAQNAQ